jgi:hypothetical protein
MVLSEINFGIVEWIEVDGTEQCHALVVMVVKFLVP